MKKGKIIAALALLTLSFPGISHAQGLLSIGSIYDYIKQYPTNPKTILEIGGVRFTGDNSLQTTALGGAGTFASQAEAEGGTETTKVMSPLRTYQAVTSYSFLKSNIDVSPVDGYPDKSNGLLGTTMSPSDTLTWNMPADKDFKINMSGTGKLIASFGTNTSTLNTAMFTEYVWTGTSSVNADTNGSLEVDLFNGTFTASSNPNCIWELDFAVDQTVDASYTPAYKIYLAGSSTPTFMNNASSANIGGMYYSGWIANYGSTTTQFWKNPASISNNGVTPLSQRINQLFNSNGDVSVRLTGSTGKASGSFYSSLRYLRIRKTQP